MHEVFSSSKTPEMQECPCPIQKDRQGSHMFAAVAITTLDASFMGVLP